MSQETELAWAAGFFDGEGNIRCRIQRDTRPHRNTIPYGVLSLSMAQTDRRVLDRFCAAVGAGKIYGPYQPRTPKSSAYYQYNRTGVPAEEVFSKLRPYLSEVKRKQGDDAIVMFHRTRNPTKVAA